MHTNATIQLSCVKQTNKQTALFRRTATASHFTPQSCSCMARDAFRWCKFAPWISGNSAAMIRRPATEQVGLVFAAEQHPPNYA